MTNQPVPITISRSTVRPLAVACYLFPGIMAVLFMTGAARAGRLTDASSPFITDLWQIGLLLGSLLSLLGVLFQLQSWPGGLLIEAAGTMNLGIMLGIYGAVLLVDNKTPPWWTVMSTVAISLGCLGRSAQAIRERQSALRAAAVVIRQ